MIFTLASLGLPGTSGFVGEFLILIGVFQTSVITAIMASLGIILAAAYMLWLYKRIIFGRLINEQMKVMKDINKAEIYIFAPLIFLILYFGFYPDPLFSTIDISVNELIKNYQIDLNYHLENQIK